MIKKIAIAALAAWVSLTVVGFVLFGSFMKVFEKEMAGAGDCVNMDAPVGLILLANLMLALLLAVVFVRWANVRTFLGGVTSGIIIVLLVMVWFDIWMFANFHFMTLTLGFLDIALNTINGTLAAGVAGWVLGKVK